MDTKTITKKNYTNVLVKNTYRCPNKYKQNIKNERLC